MREEIQFLNPKKAMGNDLMTSQTIKELKEETKQKLIRKLTAMIWAGVIFPYMVNGKIINFSKTGSIVAKDGKIRPICVLTNIFKLVEKTIKRYTD